MEWNGTGWNKTEENVVISESCVDSQDPESKTKLLSKDYYVDDAN